VFVEATYTPASLLPERYSAQLSYVSTLLILTLEITLQNQYIPLTKRIPLAESIVQ